ncbi:hypothetical protein ABZX75_07390 [Streptomyces sp. NPDC003038]|uniref:hypothetical protein n=1 Tax=unclassified Streptomyces TaxID=2593676 RepID=UPI0033AF3E20
MSSKNRARSIVGPQPRRAVSLAGGALASMALVLAGIATPAAVAAPSAAGAVAGPSAGDDCRGQQPNKGKGQAAKKGGGDKCKTGPRGPRGPRGPQGPAGPCSDVDAYNPSASQEVKAVLDRGTAFAGIRSLTPSPSDYIWYDLTDNNGPNPSEDPTYPAGACAISIAAQANNVSIEVLTTGGALYETTCDPQNVMGTDTLVCTEIWTLVDPGPNGSNQSAKDMK